MLITDPAARILTVNPAFTKLTGWSEREAIGQNPRILQSGRHDEGFYRDLWRSLTEFGHWQGTIWDRRRDRRLYCARISIDAARDQNGALHGYVGALLGLGSQEPSEERLRRLAYFDALTGLPNRLMLRDRIERAVAAARRNRSSMAVMLMDLDGFKHVNDAHGHHVGDELLRKVGGRLARGLRDVDTVARLGGDEFVVLVPEIESPGEAESVAKRVIRLLEPAFLVGGRTIHLGVSIGISTYPSDGTGANGLLIAADAAMYGVKRRKRRRQ
jgi:diguanylate cyclase (GGDEF)-like protein/PAS domain S-box-containing protein